MNTFFISKIKKNYYFYYTKGKSLLTIKSELENILLSDEKESIYVKNLKIFILNLF